MTTKKGRTAKTRVRRMYTVEGTNALHKVGYDYETQLLVVQFENLAVWSYENVTPATFAALLNAESVGRYFHMWIRGKPDEHKATKLSAGDTHVVKGVSTEAPAPADDRPLLDTLEGRKR